MITFYISEAFKSLARAKFASFVLILTTCIAILFAFASISLYFISGKIESHLKSRVELTLFISDSSTSNDVSVISKQLKSMSDVKSVTYIDKEKAKELFIKETGHDFQSILEANPLPASFNVKLNPASVNTNTIESTANQLRQIKGVTEVVYDYDLILKVMASINSFKMLIYIVSGFLVLLTVYFYFALNRFILHTREKQIITMKLVGAKLSAIKLPIFISSFVVGIIASIICVGIAGAGLYVISKIYVVSHLMNMFYLSSAAIILLGIIFGVLGGYLSVRKINLKFAR